ncbi:MAG: PHP domain-containing protein [Candidatus Helarchaeota archaeon]
MIDFHIHSEYSDGDQTLEEIVSTAKRRQLEAIAITDHISHDGTFMYLRNTEPPRPLSEYIRNIKKISKETGFKIYIGAEISDFSSPSIPLIKEFSNMDLILVETQKPRGPTDPNFDPIKRAVSIKKQFKNIPVGLAHPEIDFIEHNIDSFGNNEIFLELNGDKLSRTNSPLQTLLNKIKTLLINNPNIKISIGSDAHQIFMIGSITPIWNFIVNNDFLDKLILFPFSSKNFK